MTLTTKSHKILVVFPDGRQGLLTVEAKERAQVMQAPHVHDGEAVASSVSATLSPDPAFVAQGLEAGWTALIGATKPAIRHRHKAIGNAVSSGPCLALVTRVSKATRRVISHLLRPRSRGRHPRRRRAVWLPL